MDYQTAAKPVADSVDAQRPPVTYSSPDRKWFLPVSGGLREVCDGEK